MTRIFIFICEFLKSGTSFGALNYFSFLHYRKVQNFCIVYTLSVKMKLNRVEFAILQVGVGSPGVPVRVSGGGVVGGGGPGPGSGGPGSVGAVGPGVGVGPNGPGSVGGGGPRSQGPPPPYHQTTRSASVPIAIQSPNPSSPNNPTSNLSLPSPRASSALNSPADCNRQFQLGGTGPAAGNGGPAPGQRSTGPGAAGAGGHLPGQSPTSQDSPNPAVSAGNTRLNHSNPGTPVSHGHLTALSPSGTPQKDSSSLDFPNNQPSSGKIAFVYSFYFNT